MGKNTPRPTTKLNTQNPDKPLTARQKHFVDLVVNKNIPPISAVRLSYDLSNPDSATEILKELNRSANVVAALNRGKKENEKVVQMNKKRVMEGFLEAIDMAKMKGDPFVMISGWREIAKMCGYYEPIRHKIDVNHTGLNATEKLMRMTDAQLLQLANEQGALDGDFKILDAEILPIENSEEKRPPKSLSLIPDEDYGRPESEPDDSGDVSEGDGAPDSSA